MKINGFILPKEIEIEGLRYGLHISWDRGEWVLKYESAFYGQAMNYFAIGLPTLDLALEHMQNELSNTDMWHVPIDDLIEAARPEMEKIKDPEKWLAYIRGYNEE